jgi:hypothetical protein
MDHQDGLAEQFEASRTRLRAVAYRILGSLSEVDDEPVARPLAQTIVLAGGKRFLHGDGGRRTPTPLVKLHGAGPPGIVQRLTDDTRGYRGIFGVGDAGHHRQQRKPDTGGSPGVHQCGP